MVIHSDSDFATVAYLRIKRAALVPKTKLQSSLHVPPMLEYEVDEVTIDDAELVPSPSSDRLDQVISQIPLSSVKRGNWVMISNVQSLCKTENLSISDEVHSCFELLRGE